MTEITASNGNIMYDGCHEVSSETPMAGFLLVTKTIPVSRWRRNIVEGITGSPRGLTLAGNILYMTYVGNKTVQICGQLNGF
jgi:hypothetical protein